MLHLEPKKVLAASLQSCIFLGPELRPDGRTPRVKSDLFAVQTNRAVEHETTTTPEPFVEPFFASPSSPQPFIFRGTPDPYSEPDLLGSASTVKPFFPTVKSIGSISQSPFSIQSPSVAPPQSDVEPPSFQGTFSLIILLVVTPQATPPSKYQTLLKVSPFIKSDLKVDKSNFVGKDDRYKLIKRLM